jgi:primosomal protein N' (replication factor Y)
VLLGSATPAFETYYLAQQGTYGYVPLFQRFAEIALPEVDFIDLHEAKKAKTLKGNFTEETVAALQEILKKKEQAILFLNRRGYAPYLRCAVCEEVPQCPNCNVSLTLHLNEHELRCHYCGHHERQSQTCPSCTSPRLEIQGFGTERIEDELALLLPEARVLRMDRDTTRKKDDYQRIISAFENHEADFLIGTQMVSKGLDFARVSLVLIFDIDRMLHFPDFRAHERSFQLITQVAGRAGRRNTRGKVLIQTHKPQDSLLKRIAENAYTEFVESELLERQDFKYPPFTRTIRIVIRHEEYAIAQEVANKLTARLKPRLGWRVVGPEAPLIDRVRNRYIQHILLKLERERKDFGGLKAFLFQEIESLQNQQAFRKVLIHADVDPA